MEKKESPSFGDRPSIANLDVRTELLGQLVGAQLQLEAGIADLRAAGSYGPALVEIEQRLAVLQALQKTLATAHPSMLTQLRAEISAASVSATAAAQQAQSSIQTAAAALEAINIEARQLGDRTQRALFDDRILDASLRFGSAEEEDAYRKREAERLAQIAALNPNAPHHDRDRLIIQQSQLQDAMAHGADRDPRAHAMQREIDDMLRRQRAAEIAAGRNPVEYDREVETFRQKLPRHADPKEAQEKAWLIAQRRNGDSAYADLPGIVTAGTVASLATPTAQTRAAARATLDDTPDALDESPTTSAIQQAANQLRAAGVSALEKTGNPKAPAPVVTETGGLAADRQRDESRAPFAR